MASTDFNGQPIVILSLEEARHVGVLIDQSESWADKEIQDRISRKIREADDHVRRLADAEQSRQLRQSGLGGSGSDPLPPSCCDPTAAG